MDRVERVMFDHLEWIMIKTMETIKKVSRCNVITLEKNLDKQALHKSQKEEKVL